MSVSVEETARNLDAMAEIYRLLPPRRVRRLTVPAIFNRAYDENFISDYLSYILNPEINGIGVAPLNALLTLVDEPPIEADAEVKIVREYEFKGGGRIDFLIWLNDETILGIENKITALEDDQQTVSYTKSIAGEFPDLHPCLIFLTPQGTPAQSPDFQAICYADLTAALRAIPFSPLPDIHKSVIWEDFLAHMEEYIIMGEKSLDLQEKTLLYLKNQKMLEGLIHSFEEDAQNRNAYAIAKIKELFADWDAYGPTSGPSHWYVKGSWYLDSARKYYVYAQFSFRPTNLVISKNIPFSIGVYPAKEDARPFIEFLQANWQEAITAACAGVVEMKAPLKKDSWNFWIARKEYPFDRFKSSELDRVFSDARAEMRPLEQVIDRAMDEYKNSKKSELGIDKGFS